MKAVTQGERNRDQTVAMLMNPHKSKQDNRVEGFTGYFEFLKSEYPSQVFFDGQFYGSVFHALTAAKTVDPVQLTRV